MGAGGFQVKIGSYIRQAEPAQRKEVPCQVQGVYVVVVDMPVQFPERSGGEEFQVEAVDIVPYQPVVSHKGKEILQGSFQGGRLPDHLVRDSVDPGGVGRDGLAGIYKGGKTARHLSAPYLYAGYLNDFVLFRVQPRCLQVKYGVILQV